MNRKVGFAALLVALTANLWTASVLAADPAEPLDPEIEAAKAKMAEEAKRKPEDIDLKNYKYTVSDLITAVRQDDCKQVKAILDAGTSPNQFDSFGYTPLTVAAIDKRGECVVHLLKAGADVNIPSAAGWTPLIGAAMAGGSGMLIETLLNAGADINAQNQWGCTALYYAAGFGALPTVDYLLIRGAKYPGTGGECMTPLRVAQLREYPEVVKRLEQAEKDAAAKPAAEAVDAAKAAK